MKMAHDIPILEKCQFLLCTSSDIAGKAPQVETSGQDFLVVQLEFSYFLSVLSLVAKVFHLSWMGPQLSHPMCIYQATYTKKSVRLKLQHNRLLTFYFILEYSASQGHGGKESTWRLRRRWLE